MFVRLSPPSHGAGSELTGNWTVVDLCALEPPAPLRLPNAPLLLLKATPLRSPKLVPLAAPLAAKPPCAAESAQDLGGRVKGFKVKGCARRS